uniref:SFRICE_009016 n=1 Tax=Spodoptera frugiperda TaxID=7108 RepID=A0A2H1V491_SPOFR
MKLVWSLVVLSCALLEARGYPFPVFTSSANVDTWSYGDAQRGGRVLSRSYTPFSRRAVRAGPTTYSVWTPEAELASHQSIQYHQEKRRQALLEVNDTPPQENEVFYPQDSLVPVPIAATELIKPLEVSPEAPTTVKAIVPEPAQPEKEDKLAPEARTELEKKIPSKKPVEDEEGDDEDDDDYSSQPKFPGNAFFPMFFAWGGGNGPVAVANAFSKGRGGAAASEATAYGSYIPLTKSAAVKSH